MTTIIWHLADMHINSKKGVRTPSMILDEGDKSKASGGQRFLWRSLLDMRDTIGNLSKKHKAKVWTVLGGDIVELDVKKRTNQLHSHNEDVALEMAVETLEPVLDISERIFMCKGTHAHVGRMENILARDIECEEHPDTEKPIGHKWWIECEGVNFLFQHHGKLGKLPHTRANALNQKAMRLMLQYGRHVPNVFVQAHNHTHATGSQHYPVLTISAPCLKLPGDFEERIDADEPDIGGLYIIVKDKDYEWDAMLYKPKGLTKWSLKRTKSLLAKIGRKS